MKRYLSYLAVLLIIALPLPMPRAYAAPYPQEGGNTLGEPIGTSTTPPSLMMFSGCERVDVAPINEAFEQEVVELVNQHRASLTPPRPPLKRVENLDYLARYHAADMVADDYVEHPTYDRNSQNALVKVCETWDRFSKFVTGLNWKGENIAAGYTTPAGVVQGWLDSPPHRENIERAEFTEIGVGYYNGSAYYTHYWAQDFDSRFGIYPVIINHEAATTSVQEVSLYIYGAGDFDEMRLRSDGEAWTDWRPFQENVLWTLPCAAGNHTVTVEMRETGQVTAAASSSDSIYLDTPGGAVTLGNLPESLTFLYGQNNGQFSVPSRTFQPVNTASSQTASWTVTQSGFESAWLNLSAASGSTPDGAFTITPTDAGSILSILGDHTGTLTINAASTDPACPASDSAEITIHLFVAENLVRGYMPQLMR